MDEGGACTEDRGGGGDGAAINNKKRKRISFSKKRLLAKYSLDLKANTLADLKMAFPHTYESTVIYGQIKECPRYLRVLPFWFIWFAQSFVVESYPFVLALRSLALRSLFGRATASLRD
jgi:hypothetical protein